MNRQHIIDQYQRLAPNFITPKVKDWLITKDYRILELSVGTGIDGQTKLWGVSELAEENGKLDTTRRGKVFESLVEARRYFNLLNN